MEIPSFEKPYFKIKKPLFKNYNFANSIFLEIRQHLLARDSTFEIIINNGSSLFVTTGQSEAAMSYLKSAYSLKLPFSNDDYDYLKQNIRQMSCRVMWTQYSLIIVYMVQYLTTSEQEQLIDQKINDIKEIMQINSKKNDFLKIKCLYDYIISNVKYDYTFTNHSAYNALFDKKAVCEGCAALLYRLLSSANVQCRIITGQGLHERHAWNIMKVGSKWYNTDVTWDLYSKWKDRTLANYEWFLKGTQTFKSHIRDALYDDVVFHEKHPMSNVDYYNS